MEKNDFTLIHTMYIKNSNCYITTLVDSIATRLYSSISSYNITLNSITQKKCNKSIISKFYRNESNDDFYITSGNHNLRFAIVGKNHKISVNFASPELKLDSDTIGIDADLLFKMIVPSKIAENAFYFVGSYYKGNIKTGINNFQEPTLQSIFFSTNTKLYHYFEFLNNNINCAVINNNGKIFYNNKEYKIKNCSFVLNKESFNFNFSINNKSYSSEVRYTTHMENKNYLSIYGTFDLIIQELSINIKNIVTQLIMR